MRIRKVAAGLVAFGWLRAAPGAERPPTQPLPDETPSAEFRRRATAIDWNPAVIEKDLAQWLIAGDALVHGDSNIGARLDAADKARTDDRVAAKRRRCSKAFTRALDNVSRLHRSSIDVARATGHALAETPAVLAWKKRPHPV